MNRLYRLPLRTRAKNLSSGVRRRQNSSKLLITGLLALCGLAALVAVGLVAFFTFKHVTSKPKVGVVASSPAASPLSPTPAKPKEILLPLSDPNKNPPETTASANPTPTPSAVAVPQPSPPTLTSTIVPTPAPSAMPPETKTTSQPQQTDKPLSKAARKSIEKKRLEAERKRARLEKMYQRHEISTDAYDKGKEEYKDEIQKYRNAIKSSE